MLYTIKLLSTAIYGTYKFHQGPVWTLGRHGQMSGPSGIKGPWQCLLAYLDGVGTKCGSVISRGRYIPGIGPEIIRSIYKCATSISTHRKCSQLPRLHVSSPRKTITEFLLLMNKNLPALSPYYMTWQHIWSYTCTMYPASMGPLTTN